MCNVNTAGRDRFAKDFTMDNVAYDQRGTHTLTHKNIHCLDCPPTHYNIICYIEDSMGDNGRQLFDRV